MYFGKIQDGKIQDGVMLLEFLDNKSRTNMNKLEISSGRSAVKLHKERNSFEIFINEYF